MKTAASFPLFSVSFDREEVETFAFTTIEVADDQWRYVDKQGHGHFYNGKNLPTLEWVVTGTEWVGDEYDATEYEVGEWRCKLCAEVVNPGTRRETPKPILGPTTVTVAINGEEFYVSEDEYGRSVEAWRDYLRGLRQ